MTIPFYVVVYNISEKKLILHDYWLMSLLNPIAVHVLSFTMFKTMSEEQLKLCLNSKT